MAESQDFVQVGTVQQLAAFLATARSHRLFAFYRLSAYTGARRGDLLHLRWTSVNLNAAEVTFSGSTAVVRKQRVEGTTKGGRSCTVSLDRDTVAVLHDHHRQQAEERLAAGSAWNGTSGLVFTRRWGEPLYPDTVTALMTKLINRHNKPGTPPAELLPHARLHYLRHLHATTLLLAGARPRRRGPARPRRSAVTLRVYALSCASTRQASATSSPRPSTARVSKTVSKAGQTEQPKAAFALLRRGGQGRGRTADLPLFRRTLVPTELPDLGQGAEAGLRLLTPTRAVLTGFEPATSTLTGWRALRAALQDQAALTTASSAPNGIRTRAAALKGRCPRPLDDGGSTVTAA